MIKEKKGRNRKVDKKKLFIKELVGYLRTTFLAFCVALIFTLLLAFHARSEMIKNLYVNKNEQYKIEQNIAKQIVAHSDFTKSLSNKNYSICLQVGNLYYAAGDYKKAEYAYYLASQKSPNGAYNAYYKLALALIELNKLDEAIKLIASVPDKNNVMLIKFKTRSYIVIGDKFYSVGKFLKAAEFYEKADYYYSRLNKFDKVVKHSINDRLTNAYLETASVIIQNGYNTDAIRFLNKALEHSPNNATIQYRLAIVYSDLDPISSIKYFDSLQHKVPQEINFDVYINALMKAANIEDIKGNGIKAKYYRYKVNSLEQFLNAKVINKNDIEVYLDYFSIKKFIFTYHLNAKFKIKNISSRDIVKMETEFILRKGDTIKETIRLNSANRKQPLLLNGENTADAIVNFNEKIYTKNDLQKYFIDIYMFKDEKYKTLIGTFQVPANSIYSSK